MESLYLTTGKWSVSEIKPMNIVNSFNQVGPGTHITRGSLAHDANRVDFHITLTLQMKMQSVDNFAHGVHVYRGMSKSVTWLDYQNFE